MFKKVQTAVTGLTTAFSEFRTQQEKRLREIERELEQRALRADRPGVTAFASTGNLAAERKALGALVKTGSDVELKSVTGLSVDSDPAGGYVTLPHMAETMIKRIYDQSPIRRLARVRTIETGDGWQEPIDADDMNAEWVSERQARPVLPAAELALLTVPLNELYSNVRVTQKLLDLSFINLGRWIEEKLADRFARSESLAYVTGDGVGQPQAFCRWRARAPSTAPGR